MSNPKGEFVENPAYRQLGKTKIDNLYLDSSSWYIDDEPVTASAADLNSMNGQNEPSFVFYNASDSVVYPGQGLYINGYNSTYNCFSVVPSNCNEGKFCQLLALYVAYPHLMGEAVRRGSFFPTYIESIASPHNVGDPAYVYHIPGNYCNTDITLPANAFSQVAGRICEYNTVGISSKALLDTNFREIKFVSYNQIEPTALSGLSKVVPDTSTDSFVVSHQGENKRLFMTDVASSLAGSGLSANNGKISVISPNFDTNTGLVHTVYAHLDLSLPLPSVIDIGPPLCKGTTIGARFLLHEAPVPNLDDLANIPISIYKMGSTKLTEDYILIMGRTNDLIGMMLGVVPSTTPNIEASDHILLSCPQLFGVCRAGDIEIFVDILANQPVLAEKYTSV
jgi:hypothetical protein